METFLQIDLSLLFLVAVILIWFMIAYQLLLTLAGFFHFQRSKREQTAVDEMNLEYPMVSILIPAHNEERVIGNTLEAMLQLDYPTDRMEIVVIDDGSEDETANIIRSFVSRDTRVLLHEIPKGEGGKGKSSVLNLGIETARGEVIAVYDADNTPNPSALKYLVAQLLLHEDLGAVLGKFRTRNRKRNLLTRFINIETLSFQSILQAGRWQLFDIATLPGTNFVVWKHIVTDLGGWDEDAITEDSELSIRMYMQNWKIKYIPYSVTYEQEPETLRAWIKQRTRWVQGNNYVAKKFFRRRKDLKSRKLRLEVTYSLLLYYVFFFAIVISDILFILSVSNLVAITLPGPYTLVWILAIILFLAEIFLAISYDGEDSLRSFWYIGLMYFTYCQLWIFVVARAFFLDLGRKEKHEWDKTVRFAVEQESVTAPEEQP